MKILVCCKVVIDEELIETKGNELILDNIPTKISQYDLNAIEAGKQLKKSEKAHITVVSAGHSAVLNESKIRKDILSRGADDLIVINNDEASFNNSLEVSNILKEAISNIDDYDLILTGTGSSDLYTQSTGIQLGTLLDLPTLNNVTNIAIEDGKVVADRTLEDSVEVFELTMPCVLSLSSEINTPSIPAMRDIMQAGRKPVEEVSQSLKEDDHIEVISEVAPEQADRQQLIFEEADDDAIENVIKYIKAEAL